jgi:hypothetical protein
MCTCVRCANVSSCYATIAIKAILTCVTNVRFQNIQVTERNEIIVSYRRYVDIASNSLFAVHAASKLIVRGGDESDIGYHTAEHKAMYNDAKGHATWSTADFNQP